MEALRVNWTDNRIDDLSADMNRRFEQVDNRFDEVDNRFDEVDRRFDEVNKRFERVEEKIEALGVQMGKHNEERAAESRGFYHSVFLLMVGLCSALIGMVGLLIVQL